MIDLNMLQKLRATTPHSVLPAWSRMYWQQLKGVRVLRCTLFNRTQFFTMNTSSVWIHLLLMVAHSRLPHASTPARIKMKPLSLSSRHSLCDLLSKTYRSIIGVSWQRVSGTQQITAGCRPGGFVALLSEKRNGVNADKHWRTRVIYDTSIKRSANTPPTAGTFLTLTGLHLHSTARDRIIRLLILLNSHILLAQKLTIHTHSHTFICRFT